MEGRHIVCTIPEYYSDQSAEFGVYTDVGRQHFGLQPLTGLVSLPSSAPNLLNRGDGA